MTMNKRYRILAAVLLGAAALSLGGCASEAKSSPGVWGYVAAQKNAQLSMAEDQRGASEILVDRVVSPGPAWLVVHVDDNGKPGVRVGLKHVSAGVSNKVYVPLVEPNSSKVIVALHADRGARGRFDFDMMNKEMSPDRPFFVNRKELAKVVTVR